MIHDNQILTRADIQNMNRMARELGLTASERARLAADFGVSERQVRYYLGQGTRRDNLVPLSFAGKTPAELAHSKTVGQNLRLQLALLTVGGSERATFTTGAEKQTNRDTRTLSEALSVAFAIRRGDTSQYFLHYAANFVQVRTDGDGWTVAITYNKPQGTEGSDLWHLMGEDDTFEDEEMEYDF